MNPTLQTERDTILQNISNMNPKLGDSLMDTLGYTNSPNAPTTITSESLSQNTPLNIVPTPQDTTDYSAVNMGIPDYNSIISAIQAPTQAETDLNTSKSWIQKQIDKITTMGGSVGQDGTINTDIAQNNALEENLKRFGFTGSADAFKQLTDVNNQISGLKKEALAIPLQIQEQYKGTGATKGGVAPIQSSQLRENAIKSLGLASIAETIQGNISTAANLAERAVNIEFAPLEAQLKAQMFNYNMNKDALERADKKKAQALEFAIQERNRALDTAKEDKKIIYGFAAEAAKNGAPALIIQRAQQSTDPLKALETLSQYMSDPEAKANAIMQRKVQQAQIDKIYADIELSKDELKLKYSTTNPDGTTKPLTDAQATSLGYANRIFQASQIIDRLGSSFTGGQSYFGQYAPNILKSEDRQLYEQAQRNFINAVLRKESGAVISNEEFDNARKQYFPQPGDTEATVLQKKQNRDTIYQNFLRNAGNPTGASAYNQTVTSNGKQYVVGQVYQDKSGARWVVDINGKWTKQ